MQAPDIDSIKRFLEVAKDNPFLDVFMLALYTGIRRSELSGLRWEGIDFNTSTLRVTGTLQRITGQGLVAGTPKTPSSRRPIALGAAAIAMLHAVRGKQLALQADLGNLYRNPENYVFTDQTGNPIDPDRLSKAFRRVVKTAELAGISLHKLRHTHASLLSAEAVNIKAISERLGHSNVSLTLNVYSHLLPGTQAQAAEVLDRRLSE